MKKVNFTEMKNGSKEDYLFLDKLEKEYVGETADRILNFLSRMTTTLEGYKITRLEHSLQSATRAFRNNESEEMVVACLLHDICLLYTSPSPRDTVTSRMPSSA